MDIIAFCLPVLGILSYRIPPQNWHMPPKSSFGRGICWFPGCFNHSVQVMFFSPTWDPQAGSQGAAASSFRCCRCRWHLWWWRFWYLKSLDIERKDALEKVCQIKMYAPCMIEEVMWNCWNCPDYSYIRSFLCILYILYCIIIALYISYYMIFFYIISITLLYIIWY